MNLDELRLVLRSSLVADALDSLGRRHQCLGWDIVPLERGRRLIGHAFPVSLVEVDAVPEVPYVELLRALDAIGPDEVFVVPTARSERAAVWGELLSSGCLAAGAAGALTDGLVRDAELVRGLGFPVFARGTLPSDINGRFEVTGHGEPVELDGVRIERGDLVVGDEDGVVVVPTTLRNDVIARALAKDTDENRFRQAVAEGVKPSEAFRRYGTL